MRKTNAWYLKRQILIAETHRYIVDRESHRETHTERDTHRITQRHTDTHRETHTKRYTCTETYTQRDTYKEVLTKVYPFCYTLVAETFKHSSYSIHFNQTI